MKQKVKTNNIFWMCDGILIYKERVVIPTVLTKNILKDFHTRHPEMSRMKALTRSYVYWSDMDKDIENMMKSCRSKSTSHKIQSMALDKQTVVSSSYWICQFDKRNILFCHSRQIYRMARSFPMQNAYDKDHNKSVTGTVCKIRIARNHYIWQWHTICFKGIWNFL